VIVLDIYGSAREVQGGVHSKDLVELAKKYHRGVEYIPTIEEAIEYLSDIISKEDLVIAMGAGNVWEVVEGLKE
jgi:UDP-N-acetylmuramate-alanine ligase